MTRIDPINPPTGVPLQLQTVAAQRDVSQRLLADTLGISRASIRRLFLNQWPARVDKAALAAQIVEFFESKGASHNELQGLFHAADITTTRTHKTTNATTNGITPQERDDMLPAAQTLSQGARRTFNIFANPFDGKVESDEQMFRSPETNYVEEVMWQAAVNARMVCLCGESGSGKSSSVENLMARIDAQNKSVIVIRPSVVGMEESDNRGRKLKSADILIAVIRTFLENGVVPQGMEPRTRLALRLMQDSAKGGNAHLLVIEEAHGLPVDTLRHLKRLHEHMQLGRKSMLGVLLVAHPEVKGKLNRFDLRELGQRLEVVDLQPLGSHLKSYLSVRVKRDGKSLEQIVTDCGIEALRERLTFVKGGARQEPVNLVYPLAVNNLMTAAMNAAARVGAPIVNKDVVREL